MNTEALSAADFLIYCTVRIVSKLADGRESTGTGFFFHFLEDAERSVPVIITNKHVVEGGIRGDFCFTAANDSGLPSLGTLIGVQSDDFARKWIHHPDASVDLAMFPIAPILKQMAAQGATPFYVPIVKDGIAPEKLLQELTAIEDIFMVGYPNSIWDSRHNLPIVRKGITATPLSVDYEGRKEFMIDAACFPGSSGSPIFLFNHGMYIGKKGGIVGGNRIALLGILYAGPQHTAEGEIKIVNVPTGTKPVAISRIPNNLGLCIKAARVMEFEAIIQKQLDGGATNAKKVTSE